MKDIPDFREAWEGVVFKSGKLYDFNRKYILVMQAGDDPRSWIRSKRRFWKPERKKADAILCHHLTSMDPRPSPDPPDPSQIQDPEPGCGPLFANQKEREEWRTSMAFARWLDWRWAHYRAEFFDTIRPDIRAALLQYRQRRWHMMSLLVRCPGAMDLYSSNPALAFALASNWVFHKPSVSQPMRAARSLLLRKQRHILGWLGFPATESAVRLLKNVPPRALTVERLPYLRQALHDPEMAKRLRHLPRINIGALRLAVDARLAPFCSPRLLQDVATHLGDNGQESSFGLLRDCFRMERQLAEQVCPRPFHSLEQLVRIHDEVAMRCNQVLGKTIAEQGDGHFPPPPFAGTEAIRPIRTLSELLEEARSMNHCVAVRRESIVRGLEYIYSVTAPVRCTMSVAAYAGRWVRGEIRGRFNSPISRRHKDLIFEALISSPPCRERDTTPCCMEPANTEPFSVECGANEG